MAMSVSTQSGDYQLLISLEAVCKVAEKDRNAFPEGSRAIMKDVLHSYLGYLIGRLPEELDPKINVTITNVKKRVEGYLKTFNLYPLKQQVAGSAGRPTMSKPLPLLSLKRTDPSVPPAIRVAARTLRITQRDRDGLNALQDVSDVANSPGAEISIKGAK